MNVPDQHKEVAHAWVDGKTIQVYSYDYDEWCDCHENWHQNPFFMPRAEYRIKPESTTTYLWVAEWINGTVNVIRSAKNPFSHHDSEIITVYRVDDSAKETEKHNV